MAKEILIYGYIGYDWWTGDGITAKSIKAQLDEALSTDGNVTVRINSPGGDVFEGIAIYNNLASHSDRVDVVIEGIAYSMAAVIALAGGNIKMANNATIMIHNVSGGVWGNAQDVRGALEMMEKLDNSLAVSIAEKTGLTTEKVKSQWMDYQDHTLTAQEAKAANLVDEVITMKKVNVPENIANLSPKEVLAWYASNYQKPQGKNLLESIKNTIKDGIAALGSNSRIEVVSDAPPENSTDETDMKIKIKAQNSVFANALGITFADGETEKEHDFTDADVSKINAQLEKETSAKALAEQQLSNEKAAHELVKTELSALKERTIAAGATPPDDEGKDTITSTRDEKVKPISATTQRAIDLQEKRKNK